MLSEGAQLYSSLAGEESSRILSFAISPVATSTGCSRKARSLSSSVHNLALNAIQAMNNTEITARQLLITSSLATDNWVHITVEDTGPGIASELLDRAFESFFTTKSAGMGIGLPICRTIIEAHRERIDAANRTDSGGACFRIALPSRLSTFSAD
jgi:signal transduction histidine kinase